MTLYELHAKDVIQNKTGEKLGRIDDLVRRIRRRSKRLFCAEDRAVLAFLAEARTWRSPGGM